MEWIERLNNAINYIEEQLTGEIDYEKLGQIACCSAYHFQRLFTYMAGIPLSEYIRIAVEQLGRLISENPSDSAPKAR